MTTENKAMLGSYLRNLLGVTLALMLTTMQAAGAASPLDFGVGEWLTLANGLWAAAIPTVIRYFNKKDPAFGQIAEAISKEVSKKLAQAAKLASKKSAPKKVTKK